MDKTVDKIQKDFELNKSYKKSIRYQVNRVTKQKKIYKLYEKHQEINYQEKMVLTESRVKSCKETHSEHIFSEQDN